MSSQNYTIVALVALGAGAWWLLSARGSQEARDVDPPSVAGAPIEGEAPAPVVPQSPAIVANNSSDSSVTGTPRGPDAPPAPVTWPARALEFAEQADPDPALSREIESAIHRAIDTTLDRSRYEVHSVTCRGQSCQILSVAQASGAGNQWPPAVAAIMRELMTASIRKPGTDMELKPMLQALQQGGDHTGIVTMIGLQ